MKNTNQYGNSPRGLGPSAELEKHPGPVERDQEHWSNMKKVDAKESHDVSKGNMAANAQSQAPQALSDNHPYKHQSHWSKSGEIKNVVGSGTPSGNPGGDASHPDDFGGSMSPGEYHRSGTVKEVKKADY